MTRPPGVEFHTFTVIGRCARTGRLGIGTTTRSLAVGARVPHVRARLGAVAIMAIADARLGYMALRLLETGYKAPAVIEELVKGDPYAEYRQLGVIDELVPSVVLDRRSCQSVSLRIRLGRRRLAVRPRRGRRRARRGR